MNDEDRIIWFEGRLSAIETAVAEMMAAIADAKNPEDAYATLDDQRKAKVGALKKEGAHGLAIRAIDRLWKKALNKLAPPSA